MGKYIKILKGSVSNNPTLFVFGIAAEGYVDQQDKLSRSSTVAAKTLDEITKQSNVAKIVSARDRRINSNPSQRDLSQYADNLFVPASMAGLTIKGSYVAIRDIANDQIDQYPISVSNKTSGLAVFIMK